MHNCKEINSINLGNGSMICESVPHIVDEKWDCVSYHLNYIGTISCESTDDACVCTQTKCSD
jgi:hypothetical protein